MSIETPPKGNPQPREPEMSPQARLADYFAGGESYDRDKAKRDIDAFLTKREAESKTDSDKWYLIRARAAFEKMNEPGFSIDSVIDQAIAHSTDASKLGKTREMLHFLWMVNFKGVFPSRTVKALSRAKESIGLLEDALVSRPTVGSSQTRQQLRSSWTKDLLESVKQGELPPRVETLARMALEQSIPLESEEVHPPPGQLQETSVIMPAQWPAEPTEIIEFAETATDEEFEEQVMLAAEAAELASLLDDETPAHLRNAPDFSGDHQSDVDDIALWRSQIIEHYESKGPPAE